MQQFCKDPMPSPIQVKRSFRNQFGQTWNLSKIEPHRFIEVFHRFQKYGIASQETPKREPTATGDANVMKVNEIIEKAPKKTITEISEEVGLSKTSAWRILRVKLGLKPYRFTLAQELTEEKKEARLEFCQWIREQGPTFPRRIIFGDEKWFCLHQKPNRQNNRIWSLERPDHVEEVNVQGDIKVMALAIIVDRRVLPITFFEDEDGDPVSVNAQRYLDVIRDQVLPFLPGGRIRDRLYWQQDGATAHTARIVMDFLKEQFGDRIISRRSNHPWPASSPDLSPLDFFFWSVCEQKVFKSKPTNIEELKEVVRSIPETISEEVLENVEKSFFKRITKCIGQDGGHFEHLL